MKRVYVTGHSEYDTETLKSEYERDLAKGLDIHLPANYFPLNDPNNSPENNWRSHGYLLYHNWLNHYVYERKYFGKDCSG
jgi:homoserine O-succinyltransferase